MEVRPVTPAEFRATEELTREAFWNHFQPGADEHFIAHSLRKSQDQVHCLTKHLVSLAWRSLPRHCLRNLVSLAWRSLPHHCFEIQEHSAALVVELCTAVSTTQGALPTQKVAHPPTWQSQIWLWQDQPLSHSCKKTCSGQSMLAHQNIHAAVHSICA
ncbi:GCN5-related N-acetyltransferase [Durusdinium trenchii]|uniref:GCN5-related N-acetyltransferase n=1 Tax=Durusdinium trenchii TaxID=1381693 RepID=A0ABP0JAK2_9DINO